MSDFGRAITGILSGEKWSRLKWKSVLYISLRTASFNVNGGSQGIAHICVTQKDGTIGAYTPSQCDMITTDWVQIP